VPERAQHPLEVAALLADVGARPDVVANGVLHDVVEDTGASAFDVRRRFGPAHRRACARDDRRCADRRSR
jgi:(p)ppGpp synthase/HD superfamily hydrolase